MEKVSFEVIHSTLIACYDLKKNENLLKLFGTWVFSFLTSEQENLKVNIPYFKKELQESSFYYIRGLIRLQKLLETNQLDNFEGCCIFNFNDYKKNPKKPIQSYLLRYVRSNEYSICWENSVLTSKKEFVPIFKENQIKSKENLETIYDSLSLLAIIRKNKVLNFPVLINLNLELLTLRNEKVKFFDLIQSFDLSLTSSVDIDEIEFEAEKLQDINFKFQFLLRYPYHNNIHPWVIQKNIKTLDLQFNSRFTIHENEYENLNLLPRELINHSDYPINLPLQDFKIFKTNHNLKIFKLLGDIRSEWQELNLNIYSSPFPKYWFILISKELKPDEWFNLFIQSYPSIKKYPIIQKIEHLIGELWELNWISLFIKENPKVKDLAFPAPSGMKAKRLELPLFHLKQYLKNFNVNFNYSSNDLFENEILLSAYDTFSVLNLCQSQKNNNFLIPDFIFFNYNPWIIFQIFNLQKKAIDSKVRHILLPNQSENWINTAQINQEIIKDYTIQKINSYRKYYIGQEVKDKDFSNKEKEIISEEDFDWNSEEEKIDINNAINKANQTRNNKKYEITTPFTERVLTETDKIYVFKNSLIEIEVKELRVGDLFFTLDEAVQLLNQEKIINKWLDIPNEVRYYQNQLFNDKKSYFNLNKAGLNYASGEAYFKYNYCIDSTSIDDETFIIPRKRKHWRIICNYLGISNSVMSLSFMSYYGRKKQSKFRELISNIFSLLSEKNLFSKTNNPKVIKEVTEIIARYSEIFENVEDFSENDIANSILENINKELLDLAKEVTSIKSIENEYI